VTAAEHPPIQQIADLRAGLLSPDQAADTSAHLAGCADCSEVSERLAEVSEVLAEAGRQPITMPSDVAESLDAAINRASAERAAGVPSLADRRTTESTEARPARRRRAPLLLGAAAAVVALVASGAVLQNNLSNPGSSSDSAAGGAAGTADRSANQQEDNGASQDKSGPNGFSDAPQLDKGDVVRYARAFATASAPAVVPQADALRRCDTGALDHRKPTKAAMVSFNGRPALLRLDELARTVTVVSCSEQTRVLFRSGY